MTTHGHKRTRRDPLATRELWNGSPMAISPARSHVTPPCKQRAAPPPRAAAGGCAGGACTPVRGSCSQSAAIGVHWGTASSIGPRAHMEDFGKVSAADGDVIFGVFDGHGGKFSAEYCQDQLHAQIRAQPAFPQDMPDAIRNGFLTCDGALQKELVLRDGSGGTCAVVAVVTQSGIAVGNAGDCRAVYSCGETVLELSQDHTPANEAEAVRAVNGAVGVRLRTARARPSPRTCARAPLAGAFRSPLSALANLVHFARCLSCSLSSRPLPSGPGSRSPPFLLPFPAQPAASSSSAS
jgi:hypothetical protein